MQVFDEKDENHELFSEEAAGLEAQVLQILGPAYLKNGIPEAALRCMEDLQQLGFDKTLDPEMHFTAIAALIKASQRYFSEYFLMN
jgi:hypothetical protein